MNTTNIKTIIFNHSDASIGYVARTSTQGEEFELVNKYIEILLKKYSKLKRKHAAIFIEPQVDSGYPDIVIVEYSLKDNLNWNKLRHDLTPLDLKILFYVMCKKNTSVFEINNTLGFSQNSIEKSVKLLSDCGLVRLSKTGKYISNVRSSSFCIIHKIISIEAKIDKWSEAIRQASNNIWFATESYVLLKKDVCREETIKKCSQVGLGIILLNGKAKTILKSEKRKFPVSYASLQFNEWILRFICKEELK